MKIIIRIRLIIFIFLALLLISCTSAPSDRGTAKEENSGIPVETDKYIDPVIVKGVIDFTDPLYSFLWNTSPHNGNLVFFSSIPGKANREEEVRFAAADAARQASILYNAKVDAKFAVKSNNRDLGFLEAINIQYDKGLAGDLEAKMKILHHYRDNEGTYILAELDGVNYRGNFDAGSGEGNDPAWLYNVPVLPGYLVSIGAVQRSRYKIDSIRKADEQALASLAKQVSVVVKAKRTDQESEISGSSFSETNYEVTSAFIRGFYVLGRWSTDNGNTYHTLAVCPVDQ